MVTERNEELETQIWNFSRRITGDQEREGNTEDVGNRKPILTPTSTRNTKRREEKLRSVMEGIDKKWTALRPPIKGTQKILQSPLMNPKVLLSRINPTTLNSAMVNPTTKFNPEMENPTTTGTPATKENKFNKEDRNTD